jgi:hypothetical protein
MSKKVLVEIPSINRKCECSFHYSTAKISGSFAAGCHASTISGISLTADWSTYACITPEKDPIASTKDRWGTISLNPEEAKKWQSAFIRGEYDPKIRDQVFRLVADGYDQYYKEDGHHYGPKTKGMPEGISIVIMTDNMNSYTPEFNKSSGISNAEKLCGFKTSDFVQWLVENKIGIVTASPITRNRWHQDPENFSQVQAWMWIPPNFTKYTVPDSHFISNLAAAPTKEQWLKDAKKDTKKEKLTDEEFEARVFKGKSSKYHKRNVVG